MSFKNTYASKSLQYIWAFTKMHTNIVAKNSPLVYVIMQVIHNQMKFRKINLFRK